MYDPDSPKHWLSDLEPLVQSSTPSTVWIAGGRADRTGRLPCEALVPARGLAALLQSTLGGDRPTLHAWMVQEADGRWGVISAPIPGVGQAVLVAGSEAAARTLSMVAEGHHHATGRPVALFSFQTPAVLARYGLPKTGR